MHDDSVLTGSLPADYGLAKRYWSGEVSQAPRFEIVAELPVVVGRAIDRF